MRELLDDYERVSEECPCPVCGKSDWCLVSRTGESAICSRVTSSRPKGAAGWYHEVEKCKPPPPSGQKVKLTARQVAEFWFSLDWLTYQESNHLGVELWALRDMACRYSKEKDALFFPMHDGNWNLTGGRFRRRNGDKWSLKGGREGLFTPKPWKRRPPYMAVCEGPTDTAAATSVGLFAAGRPNCNGGAKELRNLLDPGTPVVILSDPDQPGVKGSKKLANQLDNPCAVLVGPSDFRDFVAEHSTSQVRDSILQGIKGNESPWRVLFRNMACTHKSLEPVIEELSSGSLR